MNARTTIRKILFIAIWLCIGAGMLTLLLAAISKKNKERCSDYLVTLKGNADGNFIDKKEVEKLLMEKTGTIKGQLVSLFKLEELEKQLEQNTWIRDAELYFDNKEVLHVIVEEKEPVARIFTVNGNSFYIDSLGRTMPLSDKVSARVPVFTGFPAKKTLSRKDSALLDEIRRTALFIIKDPFWISQVAQVDISADRRFEMIPMIGNHTVILGNGEHIDEKFKRLFIFYKQVSSKTGFDKYKIIDVQYAGQVVVSKQASNYKIDSVQLRKNVEKLLRQSRDAENDSVTTRMPLPAQPILLETDSAAVPTIDPMTTALESKDPNPVKTTSVSSAEEKKEEKPKSEKRDIKVPKKNKKVPKAVMPAKEDAHGYNEE